MRESRLSSICRGISYFVIFSTDYVYGKEKGEWERFMNDFYIELEYKNFHLIYSNTLSDPVQKMIFVRLNNLTISNFIGI